MNPAKNRPAEPQQPDVYLEPKWLRYLVKLFIITGLVMKAFRTPRLANHARLLLCTAAVADGHTW